MRFNWRSHLAVTALAAFSLLPFTGCSSQQQQASDEVQAEEGEGGQQGAEASEQTQEGTQEASQQGGQEGEETVQGQEGEQEGSEEVVNNVPAGEGEMQTIINEMGANPEAVAETNPAAAAGEGAELTEAVPPAEEAVVEAPAEGATTPEAPAATTEVAASSIQGLPEMGSKMPYVVEKGDTLGKISAKIYGDMSRWRDISSLTGLTNPNQIYPGDVVYFALDESAVNFASNYSSIKRAKETVQQGDTLASISSRVYGTSKGWRHIWRQNDNIDNPDQLEVGMPIYYVEKDSVKTTFNSKSINSKLTLNSASVKTSKIVKTSKLVLKTVKSASVLNV